MGFDDVLDSSASMENVNSGEVEAETSNISSLEAVSSGGGAVHAIESAAESLTRLELYLACCSEKLVNLDMLVMRMASRENDFGAFAFEEGDDASVHAEKALEFDIFYGFLDSEVRELEGIFSVLRTKIVSSQEAVSSFKRLSDATEEMEDKLHDCEGSLERCFQQAADIKVQSANFLRMMLQPSSGVQNCKDDDWDPGLEDANLQCLNPKIKMQTVEQQRNILRLLEKSLAREIDLDAKINQSRQIEESLKLQLQQEVFCTKEEAEDTWQRLFEAENSAEILLTISKELFEQMQMENKSINGSSKRVEELPSEFQQIKKPFEKQNELGETEEGSKLQLQREEVEAEDMWQQLFEAENRTAVLLIILKEYFWKMQSKDKSICGSSRRDDELQSKIQQLNEQLIEKDCALQGSETFRAELSVKVSLLERKLGESVSQLQQLQDSLEQNKEFKEKASKAENRALVAKAECKLLRESNTELNKEVSSLKSNIADASKRLERMERLLMDSNIKRLHAKASTEATQEKLSMLGCVIKDMDSLIKDLKSKVVKAERQIERAEDKCIILSESNVELIDELHFLKHRVQNLEKSLRQADESKKSTAKDIRLRTELIADFVMQLALERKRLRNQILSLAEEKKVAVMYLLLMKAPSVTMTAKNSANTDASVLSKGHSAACYEAGMMCEDMVVRGEIKTRITDSTSELDTMRNVDAGHLHFKYIFFVAIVLVILVMVAFLYHRLTIGRS